MEAQAPVKPIDRAAQVAGLWVTWNWKKRFEPAGGTRPRGSAHPRRDRSPGVCAAMRKTPRKVSYDVPPPVQKPKPFRHVAPKIGRNHPCPCNSGAKYKRCHYLAVPCAL